MDGSLPWHDLPPGALPSNAASVGAEARRAFRRLILHRHGRALFWSALHFWLLRPMMRLFVLAWFSARYARRVKRHYGVPIRVQLTEQLRLIFGDGINPKIYYFLELYRMWSDDIGRQCLMRYEIKG